MCDNKAHLAVKSIIERPFSAVKERKLSKDFRVRFARVLLHEFFVEFSEGALSNSFLDKDALYEFTQYFYQ